ncbi:N(4)-(beta-N-acetylglucosaminyl)-L-asparaginase [Isosphaera pallida ATCC 43644]|uniref:N(4)-(Beta-N-acetylglucosaminyl)-L-asparaginase n=1 Tax=Isosphaera pallida (strain ATCC 43644 / DSM 9630 / IS1B) TaxID=575540 RepID=E8R5W7_ISOPI|nr:N(4)-(beta-N-acetylglucosaminyl)-L-asparaginase [Isosphaera pallida]ADV63869.1 N(4)-(beta-N-acetylglucosaminyl)-L-asparaginase [Isosphaera pallida ATCC 43644]
MRSSSDIPSVGGLSRRGFLATAGVGLAATAIGAQPNRPVGDRRPLVVASGNGLEAVKEAMRLINEGADPLDAAIEGVAIVEADPNDRTVGYGGIPNEDGVVELDSAVMHGPTHSGGAVAALRNIMHPAAVARLVMKRTDHCLLVGEGALRFAKAHGFKEQDLLTEESRKIWLYWKEASNPKDDRIPPPDDELDPIVKEFFGIQADVDKQPINKNDPADPDRDQPQANAAATRKRPRFPRDYGTIHCSALDTHGDLGCVTTTSGLYYKIPGRVGDSPIFGAGLFLDNAIGSAGSTGRGEANLLNLSSFLIIEQLRMGKPPKDAVMTACKRIVEHNVVPRLRDAKGRPKFDVKFYCVTKTGDYAGGTLWAGGRMAVHDGDNARLVDCEPLFDEPLQEWE